MASKEVTFEEFQLKDTTAAIYVLDETLYGCAKNLAQFLTEDSEIGLCYVFESHLKTTIVETFDSLKKCKDHPISLKKYNANSISIRDSGYLDRLIAEAKIRRKGHGLHHDVIIILGHTSVKLAEDKELIAAFGKMNPTIIAFLGCCGGNTRYGPILTMSYLLPLMSRNTFVLDNKAIIAFYQRQVYIDELTKTSLVIGLKYYLGFINTSQGSFVKRDHLMRYGIMPSTSNFLEAHFAFALAKCDISVLTEDPTVFINDRVKAVEQNAPQLLFDREIVINDIVEQNAVQLLFDKCDLTAEEVPLPCMQLALYNSMVTDCKEFWSGKSEKIFELNENEEMLPDPEKPYPEHKLVDDLLWQLDQQRIKITIYGVTQEIDFDQDQEKISVPLPEEIVVSEDPISLESPKSTEVSEYIQGIKITFRTSSNSSKIKASEDKQRVDITFWTPKSRTLNDNSVENISVFKDQQNIKILLTTMSNSTANIYIRHKKVAQTRLIYIRGTGSQGVLADRLSKICLDKIEELQLYKIIPLICEIKFIKLLEDTQKRMRTGDESSWKEIDHLQFLVAVLRGNWGKNSLINIKKWATFHLIKSKNVKEDNSELLHQYKLCCICFVLVFEDSFVRVIQPDEITVRIKKGNKLIDMTLPSELPNPGGTFPADGELSNWVDLFQYCNYKPHCVNLYHNKVTWEIGNKYGHSIQDKKSAYQYQHHELLLCLGALSDGAYTKFSLSRDKKTLGEKCYNVKEFCNEDDMQLQHMKYFDDAKILKELNNEKQLFKEILYVETKLLLNSKTFVEQSNEFLDLVCLWNCAPELKPIANQEVLKKAVLDSKHWKKVSSCRFVFAQFPITKIDNVFLTTGILFYTDTHYGHNLFNFNEHMLRELHKCTKKCFKKNNKLGKPYMQVLEEQIHNEKIIEHDLLEAIKNLCWHCKCRMLEELIKEMEKTQRFPFIKVGRLTLIYDVQNEKLTKMKLDKCSENIAVEHYIQLANFM